MIYYPLPLHKQTAFIPYINKNSLFPVSESLCTDVISLPIHTEMKEEQLEYISNQIIQYLTNK
jgi:UDP-2-acetamido-2-deoxy-ribo-hexuluronate aminotransferase